MPERSHVGRSCLLERLIASEALADGPAFDSYEGIETVIVNFKSYEGLKQREAAISPHGRTRIPEALGRLVELSEAQGRSEDAKKWRAEREKYPPAK